MAREIPISAFPVAGQSDPGAPVPESTVIPVAIPVDKMASLEKASIGVRLGTLAAILIPLLAVMSAPLLVWGWGFGWVDLGLLLSMYFLSAVGITVGFHRLFVHRSFETFLWVQLLFAVLGSMALQGSLFQWVALHRRHHQYSDTAQDPHTPHHKGDGLLGFLKGMWHAHIGWLFRPLPSDLERYLTDLRQSWALQIVSNLFPIWVAVGLILPAVLGGVITGSWAGFWTGLIWGGLVRLFMVHHVTWSVNSACHLWGRRPYRSADESRNNLLFGILALGEGWHNTHHAFPTSARHGLRWWQIDVSYWVIRTLACLRLGWNVKLPTAAAQGKSLRES